MLIDFLNNTAATFETARATITLLDIFIAAFALLGVAHFLGAIHDAARAYNRRRTMTPAERAKRDAARAYFTDLAAQRNQ